MKNNERIVIYSLGFILGMVLVSVIFMRRAAFRDKYYDSFQDPIYPATVRRVEALPQDIEEVMLQGRILDFGYLPSDLDRQQRVWLIKFKKSYPHVRVVQSLASGALMYITISAAYSTFGAVENNGFHSSPLIRVGAGA